MEPESLHPSSNSVAAKFVAGPTRLDRNPLCPPAAVRGEQELEKTAKDAQAPLNPANSDLTKPDAQFERYKHMMQRSVYNQNVNSNFHRHSDYQTIYHPPAPFHYSHVQHQIGHQ